ncbi:MAG: EamA family transporter [Negativicutes bacterium]|nr:EamA family transporter [Negativicutes bacterium]
MFGLRPAVILALLAVYFFWGGTYLAMRFAVETMPPLLMAGSRFLTAGAILYLWEMQRGTPVPTLRQWRGTALVGILLLLGGNGGVVWAEQVAPSGIAAIIVAVVPLWMTLLAWLWQGGDRPTLTVAFGLVLGFAGILLLVKSAGTLPMTAALATSYLALVLASVAWAAGSVYSRVAPAPASAFQGIAMQMLVGGAACSLVGLASGEWAALDPAQFSARSLLSFGYLILFGSIIGFSAYIWVLKAADPTLVSTYAYVNPIVAVFLGWALAGESLDWREGLSAAVILLAVLIITRANAKRQMAAATRKT